MYHSRSASPAITATNSAARTSSDGGKGAEGDDGDDHQADGGEKRRQDRTENPDHAADELVVVGVEFDIGCAGSDAA